MNTKIRTAFSITAFILGTGVSMSSYGFGGHGGHGYQACLQQELNTAGVSNADQLSSAQQADVKQCVEQKHKAHHAAMVACMSKAGIAMPDFKQGPPDDKTRAALKSCHESIRQTASASAPTAQ